MRDDTREALIRAIAPETGAWQQRVGAYARLPGLLRALGADPAGLLAEAGLAPDALDDIDRTVPYAAMGRLLALGTERTGCGHFGILVGRLWRLDELGVVG